MKTGTSTTTLTNKVTQAVRSHPRWRKDEIGLSLGLRDRDGYGEFDLIDTVRQREGCRPGPLVAREDFQIHD